jgi:hypothetical protein
MKIDLNALNYKDEISIDQDFSFVSVMPSIKDVRNAHFIGKTYLNTAGETKLEGNLKADLILIDAVDLSDFDYKIDINIDEIIENDVKTLDINEILWENIVLEVPIRVTKHEAKPMQGKNWEIKDEESRDNEIDPRLEKLQELFKGGE